MSRSFALCSPGRFVAHAKRHFDEFDENDENDEFDESAGGARKSDIVIIFLSRSCSEEFDDFDSFDEFDESAGFDDFDDFDEVDGFEEFDESAARRQKKQHRHFFIARSCSDEFDDFNGFTSRIKPYISQKIFLFQAMVFKFTVLASFRVSM